MEWHGVRAGQPDWSYESHSLAVRIEWEGTDPTLYLALNAYWEPLTFELPPRRDGQARWRRCIDTSRAPPHDICFDPEAPLVAAAAVVVEPRSVAAFLETRAPIAAEASGRRNPAGDER